MRLFEAILEKVSALPPDKQVEVLHFAEALAEKSPAVKSGEPGSVLRKFASLNIDGPPDASSRFKRRSF